MKPFNPLEKQNLGKSVTQSLIHSEPVPLGSIQRFIGAGVYAIYYLGDFDSYTPLHKWNRDAKELHLPIYVGKAVPKGGRKGTVEIDAAATSTALFKRMDEHRKSITRAENLSISDFWCRYLVVDDIWIPLGESLLIQYYRPLWNAVVDGFGNHDPGRGRFVGAASSWDTIHQGRLWGVKCAPSVFSETDIRHQISEYWKTYEGPKVIE